MRRDLVLAALAAGAFVAITVMLAAGEVLVDLDLTVYRWAEAYRSPATDLAGRVLNRVGQGLWLLTTCAVLAGWLGLVRWRAGEHRWRVGSPLLYVATAAILVIPAVLVLKDVTGRGAPSSALPPEQTVQLFGNLPAGEYATGYPGGHAVNTVVWYGVLLVLVTGLLRAYGRGDPSPAARIAVRVVPPVIVLFTTTFLSFHWLTDALAGFALGLLIDRLLALVRRVARRRAPAGGRGI